MKTVVKIKDILKIINPEKDGIFYHGEKINIDFDLLNKYVTSPKSYNIFSKENDNAFNFYKNAALYIINFEEPSMVKIDLDKDFPIEQGIFEYVCSIYNEFNELYIDLPEVGNNAIFIKSKKLSSFGLEQANLSMASDPEKIGLTSFFTNLKPLSKNSVIDDEKITEKGKFFWKEDSVDFYSNQEWVLERLQELSIKNQYGNDDSKKEVLEFMKKISTQLINSDDFKAAMINFSAFFLKDFLFTEEGSKILPLDFRTPLLNNQIKEKLSNKDFVLLKIIFEKFHKNDRSNAQHLDFYAIDYSSFVNNVDVIEHLKKQKPDMGFMNSYVFTKFTITACYKYFNEDYKKDKDIVLSYINCIKTKRDQGGWYINTSELFKINAEILDRQEILKEFISCIDIKEYADKLKKDGVIFSNLSNKDFFRCLFNQFSTHQIFNTLNLFHNAQDIDKDFLLEIIHSKPDIYENLLKNKDFFQLMDDIEILQQIYDLRTGRSSNYINGQYFELLKPYLLQDHPDPGIEFFKLNFVIGQQLNLKMDRYADKFFTPDERKIFKEKYHQLKYQFFKVDDWFNDNTQRNMALRKIKDPQKIKEIIQDIHQISIDFTFDGKSFYQLIPENLRRNITFLKDTGLIGYLNWDNLTQALHYNKNVCLDFIAKDTKNAHHVPQEFFNDIDFSLKFSKIMDTHGVALKDLPLFISKFFENNEVKSDYHQFLKTYIGMNSLKELMLENPLEKVKLSVKKKI